MIIIIAGKSCVGKSSLSRLFTTKNNFNHIEMSDIMREIRYEEKLEHLSLRNFVTKMHMKYSKDFAIQFLIDNNHIEKTKVVISGIRNPYEIRLLQQTNKQIITFYINAKLHVRLLRLYNREKKLDLSAFWKEERSVKKWGDKQVRDLSIIINNNRTLEEAYKNIIDYIDKN